MDTIPTQRKRELRLMCLLKQAVRSVNPSTPLRANGLVEGGGCVRSVNPFDPSTLRANGLVEGGGCIGHYPDTAKEGT